MEHISAARKAAFETLLAVSRGAYASEVLRGCTASLDARDAGLASQIVFGCLRYQGQLDYFVLFYSGRRAQTLHEHVRIALRMGIFQLRYLDRVPAHAAVHETVELVKRHRPSATGFANAVLRKVNRNPVEWPDEATALSVPAWLLERWKAHFDAETARKIARAALEEPKRYIRLATTGASPPLPHLELEPTSVNGAFRLLSPLPPGWRLHDISSQAIVPLLDLQAGQRYLDLCAAPGNKTLQALEKPLALAIACDVSEKRIREIPSICPRIVLDATQPLPFSGKFDRILIDAPCSGTGTLGRNPEIKWRVQPGDFPRFREKQRQILQQGLRHLAPQGKLVYATCSLEQEENEEVIDSIGSEFRIERTLWRLPGREEGDGFFAAVITAA